MATYQRPKKVKNQKEDPAELIVNKLDKSAGRFEQLIEKYKREIVWTIGGIIIVFLGYMAYHTWIAKPSQIEAAEELAFAQKAYEMDSLYLALDGTTALEIMTKPYRISKNIQQTTKSHRRRHSES